MFTVQVSFFEILWFLLDVKIVTPGGWYQSDLLDDTKNWARTKYVFKTSKIPT